MLVASSPLSSDTLHGHHQQSRLTNIKQRNHRSQRLPAYAMAPNTATNLDSLLLLSEAPTQDPLLLSHFYASTASFNTSIMTPVHHPEMSDFLPSYGFNHTHPHPNHSTVNQALDPAIFTTTTITTTAGSTPTNNTSTPAYLDSHQFPQPNTYYTNHPSTQWISPNPSNRVLEYLTTPHHHYHQPTSSSSSSSSSHARPRTRTTSRPRPRPSPTPTDTGTDPDPELDLDLDLDLNMNMNMNMTMNIDLEMEMEMEMDPETDPDPDTSPSPSPPNTSKDPKDLSQYGIQTAPGTWRCAYPGCSSTAIFRRGCDLRKHFNRHRKYLFCRVKGCPQGLRGGFSSKKDRDRHEAKHNPGIGCEWEGCSRVFSRVDNMKDHVRRIHRR